MKTLAFTSSGMVWGIALVLVLGAAAGFAFLRNPRGSRLLTEPFSEPLNGVTSAKVEISAGSGNLVIDGQTNGEQALASGSLQYFENKLMPARSLNVNNGQAVFSVKMEDAGQRWLRLPWDACNGATLWQFHLNPAVLSDITAHSGGGNVSLDLSNLQVGRVSTDTGGGNVEVILPEEAANLNVDARTGGGNMTVRIGSTTGSGVVSAKSGAGNVVVHLPGGMAAKVHVSSGMGKVILDPRFSLVDKNTYQTSDFDSATDKVEITASSGAGNVTVDTK